MSGRDANHQPDEPDIYVFAKTFRPDEFVTETVVAVIEKRDGDFAIRSVTYGGVPMKLTEQR